MARPGIIISTRAVDISIQLVFPESMTGSAARAMPEKRVKQSRLIRPNDNLVFSITGPL